MESVVSLVISAVIPGSNVIAATWLLPEPLRTMYFGVAVIAAALGIFYVASQETDENERFEQY